MTWGNADDESSLPFACIDCSDSKFAKNRKPPPREAHFRNNCQQIIPASLPEKFAEDDATARRTERLTEVFHQAKPD
ncbi:hypothetical protein [Rhodopirellula sp. SWK7]|uniref:hypothetical protein n=1 Tax=Rhodopirellula sp. SWK7 TaxID=595460 RepID=UPI0002BE398B|nr:hypothetical protein [Rhodopirellula sp. SWK7]EMI41336.1 hypothetical protein RRSWK_06136 [Rhodopirellula sp. SWK7]